jgi:hypothetical protein
LRQVYLLAACIVTEGRFFVSTHITVGQVNYRRTVVPQNFRNTALDIR